MNTKQTKRPPKPGKPKYTVSNFIVTAIERDFGSGEIQITAVIPLDNDPKQRKRAARDANRLLGRMGERIEIVIP